VYFTHLDRATTRRIAARAERAAIASVDDATRRDRATRHIQPRLARERRGRGRAVERGTTSTSTRNRPRERDRRRRRATRDARRANRESEIATETSRSNARGDDER
jgi:hypothetical protein